MSTKIKTISIIAVGTLILGFLKSDHLIKP